MKCPICKKDVDCQRKELPFCSERCRLLDLGNWASQRYVISTPMSLDEEDLAETEGRPAPPEHERG